MKGGNLDSKEVGFVIEAKEYLLSLSGLPTVHLNDVLRDEKGNRALVVSLEDDHVKAFLLDRMLPKAGDRFFAGSEGLTYVAGDHVLGRIMDTLGHPIDGGEGFSRSNIALNFDAVASGIDAREEVSEQFHTGLALIDILFPIGKGQRQLLFGPTGSGKTTFVRDVIVNQKNSNVVCVYVGIGKPASFMERFAASIFTKGADAYTVIVAALAEDSTPMITIAPMVGFMLAEQFSKVGRDVLLILDDLGTHAKYAREVALLMGRIPGRQSYPGDIFYQHAHLLESAGNFNKKFGGGSITVLPVLETDIENFTDLIPTNLMATTDGHLFFSPVLRAEGMYPSIAVDRSVTRVGRQTQKMIQKDLATRLMALFVEYERQKSYMQFGTNLNPKTKLIIKQGEVAMELLKQETYTAMEWHVQVALLSLTFSPFLLNREISFLHQCKHNLIKALENDPLLEEIREGVRHALSLNEFLELINKRSHILEKVCQQ